MRFFSWFCFLLSPYFLVANLQWEKTHYLWNLGWAQQSDAGFCLSPEQYFANWWIPFDFRSYQNIPEGGLVWVQSRHLPLFYYSVWPLLRTPCSLLINDGDESFPSSYAHLIDVERFLSHPCILRVFAQNSDYTGPSSKVVSLPIGLDFHSVAYKQGMWGETGSPQEQERQLQLVLDQLKPTYLRRKRAFVDFQHSDTMKNNPRYAGENRTQIFEYLQSTGLIDWGPQLPRSMLWKTKGQYAFSISPHGNGLDCHRTWEDLVLGCIVIVKTSPLDVLYEGLPVVIVKDWSEVTEEHLDQWLIQYADAFTNPLYRKKLTHDYWLQKMRGDEPSRLLMKEISQ